MEAINYVLTGLAHTTTYGGYTYSLCVKRRVDRAFTPLQTENILPLQGRSATHPGMTPHDARWSSWETFQHYKVYTILAEN